ncbi:alpha-glucan family phosphorylase [Geminicoccaceae bacterium 1502E]|nr:alpha-glucan family phosphorylase [Geminicoccaceae bacterium 1502E]
MSNDQPGSPVLRLAAAIPRIRIAYFSMEIGLRPEMATYSGGLGMLAGDSARAAADLEIPMVFVSLVSREGYLRQEIDAAGRQVELPDPWDPAQWTEPLGAKIVVELEGREVWVRPWLYHVAGRLGFELPVILLDTDLPENDPRDRTITHRLYAGENAWRLRQEAVLGIGGVRILRALGFDLDTFHMNEGHAALLALELLRHRPGDVAAVREQCIFTTHTPVEAGHDRFPWDLVERVLGSEVAVAELEKHCGGGSLNMTRLALELSGFVNGVAKRHALTSARMFPGVRVRAITNGVHGPTWAAPSIAALYDRHLPDWRHEPEILVRADYLPDDEMWAAHEEARRALLAGVEGRTGRRLPPDVALLGFARRMTGYKRPGLLFEDPDRLLAIHGRTPMAVLVAGKAHPADVGGKAAIHAIHQMSERLRGQLEVVFLEDYGMALGKLMTGGCDVWLNTPLPPMEASGTSGMKAALNGVLNLSVLDGWWLEGCVEGETGWAIGDGAGGALHGQDAAALHATLGDTVLPLYHGDRKRWIGMMKEAVSKLGSTFNAHRMMRRYATEAYLR